MYIHAKGGAMEGCTQRGNAVHQEQLPSNGHGSVYAPPLRLDQMAQNQQSSGAEAEAAGRWMMGEMLGADVLEYWNDAQTPREGYNCTGSMPPHARSSERTAATEVVGV